MHHDDSADLVLLSRPVQRRRGRVLDAGRRPGDSRKFPPAAQRPGSHWRGKWQKECSACAEKRGKRGKAHRLRPAAVHPAGSPVTPVAKPLPRHSGSSDDLFGRCVGGRKRIPVQRVRNMGSPGGEAWRRNRRNGSHVPWAVDPAGRAASPKAASPMVRTLSQSGGAVSRLPRNLPRRPAKPSGSARESVAAGT